MKCDTQLEAVRKLKADLEPIRESLWVSGWENIPTLAHIRAAVHAYLMTCDVLCENAIESLENAGKQP